MDLHVTRVSGVPVGVQLALRLRSAINSGELRPGDQLPSLRDAATAAGVNVNTVRAAYAKLESAGVVTTEQGRGTFVAARAAEDESALRRNLREDIARLEAELVSLPLLPSDDDPNATHARARARLLSVDELAVVRDMLAARVDELHAARAAIVDRFGQLEQVRAPGSSQRSQTQSPREPSRGSSSSLAGARVRWTGA